MYYVLVRDALSEILKTLVHPSYLTKRRRLHFQEKLQAQRHPKEGIAPALSDTCHGDVGVERQQPSPRYKVLVPDVMVGCLVTIPVPVVRDHAALAEDHE